MTKKVPSLSPGRGTLTNKWVPKPKVPKLYTCSFGLFWNLRREKKATEHKSAENKGIIVYRWFKKID